MTDMPSDGGPIQFPSQDDPGVGGPGEAGPGEGPAIVDPAAAPTFDENAQHMLMPKIRRLRGFMVPVRNQQGQTAPMMGLADAQQIATRAVVTLPAFQQVLPLMDGSRTIGQIVHEVGKGLQAKQLQAFVAQLASAGLVEGPEFEAMKTKMREDYDSRPDLPPGATAQFADLLVMQEHGKDATAEQKSAEGPGKLRAQLDRWIDELFEKLPAESPRQYPEMPRGLIGPQLDYSRGWVNYASAWGRFRQTGFKPDRIVILGTNNFGSGTGVTGCDKSFSTPLGTMPLDEQLLGALKSKLGDEQAGRYLEHRYDHEREQSIEWHLPWVQHVFEQGETGDIQLLAALIHDPMVNNGESYDGNGLALQPFMDALRAAISEMSGTTLVVGSANLSHVGPQFGDKMPLAEARNQQGQVVVSAQQAQEFRDRVSKHDQEMIKLLVDRKPDDLLGSLAWQQNHTRWNAVGSIMAAMKVVDPERFEVLNYGSAMDQRGMAMVTNIAAAMY